MLGEAEAALPLARAPRGSGDSGSELTFFLFPPLLFQNSTAFQEEGKLNKQDCLKTDGKARSGQ